MKTFTTILVYLLWVPFGVGQTGIVKGHLHDTITDKGLEFAPIMLIETRIATFTDENGDFILNAIPAGTYNLMIKYVGYRDSIFTSLTVTEDTVVELYIRFPPYCKYDKNNKTCPVCKKEDKVIPIVYGLLIRIPDKNSKEGKFKSGGCGVTGCDPNWHCERDEVDF